MRVWEGRGKVAPSSSSRRRASSASWAASGVESSNSSRVPSMFLGSFRSIPPSSATPLAEAGAVPSGSVMATPCSLSSQASPTLVDRCAYSRTPLRAPLEHLPGSTLGEQFHVNPPAGTASVPHGRAQRRRRYRPTGSSAWFHVKPAHHGIRLAVIETQPCVYV